jgi:hypothetical protein
LNSAGLAQVESLQPGRFAKVHPACSARETVDYRWTLQTRNHDVSYLPQL